MTAIVSRFALIGRTFSSDDYKDLYRASLSSRAERRSQMRARERHIEAGRVFRGSGEAVMVPAQLSA